MIKHILFSRPSEYFNPYQDEQGRLTKLAGISQVNFFVGANNSGKSRLLRGLAREFSHYRSSLEDRRSYNHEDFLVGLLEIERSKVLTNNKKSLELLGDILYGGDRKEYLKKIMPQKKYYTEHDLRNIYEKLESLIRNQSIQRGFDMDVSQEKNDGVLRDGLSNIKTNFDRLMQMSKDAIFHVVYIPIQRSLRKLYELSDKSDIGSLDSLIFEKLKRTGQDSLQLRTLLDYFMEESVHNSRKGETQYNITLDPASIYTGESFYEDVLSLRTGKEHRRAILTGFEDFLSKSFFNGQKVEINGIEDERGQEVHIKIGDENEFPIYALGDGIQAIILLTFPIFFNGDHENQLFFFEEPELFLHPGMQRVFIEVLRRFPRVQFFIATHSNHLLDTSLDYPDDISIFSLEKSLKSSEAVFRVENLTSPNSSLLSLLGVRNSSVFLANCTIWVEGISDRLYIRKYLALYMDQLPADQVRFKEDLHFAFLEFGGNNVVHYDFSNVVESTENIKANRLSSRIFLIHDADTDKEDRHQLLYHQLGEQYKKLPAREIENLLTPGVLRATLTDYRLKTQDKLEFNELSSSIHQTETLASIAKQMIKAGQIKKIFSQGNGKSEGRLYDKAAFARAATSHIKEWKDLSEHAQKLAESLYDFIKKNNYNVC